MILGGLEMEAYENIVWKGAYKGRCTTFGMRVAGTDCYYQP